MFNYHTLLKHQAPIVFDGIANAIVGSANTIVQYGKDQLMSINHDLLLVGYKGDRMMFNIDCDIDDLDVQGIQDNVGNMTLFEQVDVIRVYGVGCAVAIDKCEVQ